MKLDILNSQWLEIVFEGRNKLYGAYDLRKSTSKTSVRALIIGSLAFGLAVSAPLIISMLPEGSDDDQTLDKKITAVNLPPKEQPKENVPPPPPPPPKVDQVKFVKPVVAKADEVTEEPPKIEEIKDKKLGDETIKGDPNAELTVEPVGNGPGDVVAEDNNIYDAAGIQVLPTFPGGMEKFYRYIGDKFRSPEEEGVGGKIMVSFVVEKDGNLTDIKVTRDFGYGSGKEAIRVLNSCPKWTPGEANGKKVRVTYSLPITIQPQGE